MNAIPTMYAGVQFRSRLEARWAAFFDLAGWRWHYEPIDLQGYIPDFVLDFYKPLLVEVKPIISWAEMPMGPIEKIRRSGWNNEAIVVGASLKMYYGDPFIGVFAQSNWLEGEWAATDSVEPFMCNHCNGNSLCSVEQSFHCRVCGAWDGDNHKSGPFDVESMWRKAGNRVQWRAPR